jgi:DNA-binding transcriptional LysR family regulator
MDMDGLNLDQLEVFVAVTDAGSFSAAARKLGRAQSAVTYAIRRLEDQVGVELFDRRAYRPVLTDAGRALLPRAQRIVGEAAAFRAQARSIAGGLEPELSLVVEAMFPMCQLLQALSGFQTQFPSVPTRVQVETLGAAALTVLDGRADLGLVIDLAGRPDELDRALVAEVELVSVASPGHPLADLPGPLGPETLREHVQLVLSDRAGPNTGQDRGVAAVRTWRIADLGAKHAMLLAGLGWGSMPLDMVEADLAAGRLVRLQPSRWDGADQMPRLPVFVVHRKEVALGPAGQWLLHRLKASKAGARA